MSEGTGKSPTDRFWAKVKKSDACWLWTGHIMRNGYGQLRVEGVLWLAHRWSFTTFVGPIPTGLHIDHVCRVRSCVRPDHLQAVSQQKNNEHLAAKLRSRSGIRGVSWDKRTQKWRVAVTHKYRRHTGHRHASLAEAELEAIAMRNLLMTNNLQDRRPA